MVKNEYIIDIIKSGEVTEIVIPSEIESFRDVIIQTFQTFQVDSQILPSFDNIIESVPSMLAFVSFNIILRFIQE